MARILFFSEGDEVSRGKLPTSMRYFGNEKIKKKKKETLVGKVSILQPERGIRMK